ncbi:uncharacterized protein LOC133204634 [Saccostrea echinata]|uniref:uncharacterized protein LOC133204634 n=1 Tax=Saccostrea echinata TaxID=191078 RepID=UPI002A833DF9|nr:uncharacterized protein LOC133204634 [Saccostrea echinata]
MNNLVIGGTLCTHRDIHRLTWNSLYLREKNQIDHLMINGIWRHTLLDVRVKRSVNVCNDDHLVTALIKITLKKAEERPNTQARFDIQRLRDNTVKAAFISDLRNKFQILQHISNEGEETSVDSTWKQVAESYTESSKKKLGLRKRNTNKDWIQQETLIAIEERKEIKKRCCRSSPHDCARGKRSCIVRPTRESRSLHAVTRTLTLTHQLRMR